MPAAPAVTVIVPLYNKRATIARTVDSILAQTFADFELIIVDDESADGGAEMVEATYRDPRISVLRQPNGGPGAARNAGLHDARAPLVAFLDADDEWRPQFLERATEVLAKHPDCAAFAASYERWPERVDRWDSLCAHGYVEGPWRLTPDIPDAQLPYATAAFSSSSAAYRRDVVVGLGGFYDRVRCTLGEDMYLWIQLILTHAIYRHAEPLAIYHMEDSELGLSARTGAPPLEPVVTDPEPLRAVCPPELRETLERWLAAQALHFAFIQFDRGAPDVAAGLVRAYPRMRGFRTRYWKLRARLAAPCVWRLLKRRRG